MSVYVELNGIHALLSFVLSWRHSRSTISDKSMNCHIGATLAHMTATPSFPAYLFQLQPSSLPTTQSDPSWLFLRPETLWPLRRGR